MLGRKGWRIAFMTSLSIGLLPLTANGQDNEDSFAAILSRQGEWVLERWDVFMGPSTDCTSGMSYVFETAGTLDVRECLERKVVRRSASWSLEDTSDVAILYLEDRPFEISEVDGETLTLLHRNVDTGEIAEAIEIVFVED